MDNAHERRIDELVDSALAGWASEPRAGLENRTMARLRAARRQRSRPAWSWFAAGIATAAVFAFVLAIAVRPHLGTSPRVPTVTPNVPASVMSPKNSATPVDSARQKIIARAARPAPVQRATRGPIADAVTSQAMVAVTAAPRAYRFVPRPRTERFPTPAALTEQELLLTKLAAQANPLVLRTLAEASAQHEIQPIEIKPIEIAPLQPGSQQSSAQGEPQ